MGNLRLKWKHLNLLQVFENHTGKPKMIRRIFFFITILQNLRIKTRGANSQSLITYPSDPLVSRGTVSSKISLFRI